MKLQSGDGFILINICNHERGPNEHSNSNYAILFVYIDVFTYISHWDPFASHLFDASRGFLRYVNLIILAATYHILNWQFVVPSAVYQVHCNHSKVFVHKLPCLVSFSYLYLLPLRKWKKDTEKDKDRSD